jgi:hypothetical protein
MIFYKTTIIAISLGRNRSPSCFLLLHNKIYYTIAV